MADINNSNQDNSSNENDKSFSELLDTFNKENKENSFEYLLDTYSNGINAGIQTGDKIKGKIISIGKDTVFIDLNAKNDGIVEKIELLDKEGNFKYNEGDTIELYVVSCNESEIILSNAISGADNLYVLKEAFSTNIPIEGKVLNTCNGGYHVEIASRKTFCPLSQMDLKTTEKPDEYIGKIFSFLIIKFEEKGRNIVVSRRKLLEQETEEARKTFYNHLKTGDILKGNVTSIKPYGAFVELFPGIEGLVHISELSWARIENPNEILNVGDELSIKVLEIERNTDISKSKIALSAKQVLNDPWDEIQDNFTIGDIIDGKITRCMKFGAFVEIAPGIEGLVHISEMSYAHRILKPEDMVKLGDIVRVMIKEIDINNKRISLSMRDVEGDPWAEVEKKYKIGQTITGILEKKEKFGFFVQVAPGITGLLPKSKIDNSANPLLVEKHKIGDEIKLIVKEIEPERRKITLDTINAIVENEWKTFTPDTNNALGVLGEKLQQALKRKENI